MKQKINRGFVVETNFSPCRCYDKAKYHVMADDAVDLDHFQWMSEYDQFKQVVSFFGKQGACPTCEEDITFDQHWIVTHQEEEKEKNHMFDVAFTVESTNKAEDVTNEEILKALAMRWASLSQEFKDDLHKPYGEAFGYSDSYDVK